MRNLIINLFLGHYLVNIFGIKFLISRNIITNLIVYSCVIYLLCRTESGVLTALLVVTLPIICLYFTSFYFLLYPPRWDELNDLQKWYCGSEVVRHGCEWILDRREFATNFMEWDRLDRIYISLTKF